MGVSVSKQAEEAAMELRYGINPQQAAEFEGSAVRMVNGQPSYVNLLDALNAWQLVREASRALGRTVAASFKHVSPAGAALSGPIDQVTADLYGMDDVGPVASAYLRARDADPKCSYGDFAAVSAPVDAELAELLSAVVCDGIVAPGFEPGTVATLSAKKGGRFLVVEADPDFVPPQRETREVFGMRLTQDRDPVPLTRSLLGECLPSTAVDDLLLGMAVLRYTQSNSVCYVKDGVTLGIGAGQQSRVDCTRLAGSKVDIWWLRRHPAVRVLLDVKPGTRRQDLINEQIRYIEEDLTAIERAEWMERLSGVSFVSDGYLPFRDNVDHAAKHGVRYIAEPGGSIRSEEVAEACRKHGITLVRTDLRLFHH
ncbi:5-aminoimidazole-4-carboxamide ribonucleotide transformylase [Kutzneria sp. CA-103260]|uniref:5-aminoimidazole-4-carboxamide ribonucleotide transformylase n=1 Tax=Kutzneria sp. CA-103260 TaxID=2802641 RepID=UPI0021130258|nr:5-aminoimidazole-4-carboxamide ribonucleotide transformylase [Kutzneria sp. CA-103260]